MELGTPFGGERRVNVAYLWIAVGSAVSIVLNKPLVQKRGTLLGNAIRYTAGVMDELFNGCIPVQAVSLDFDQENVKPAPQFGRDVGFHLVHVSIEDIPNIRGEIVRTKTDFCHWRPFSYPLIALTGDPNHPSPSFAGVRGHCSRLSAGGPQAASACL